MKHDERCEMQRVSEEVRRDRAFDCHCAERAYAADPFIDEDGARRFQRQ